MTSLATSDSSTSRSPDPVVTTAARRVLPAVGAVLSLAGFAAAVVVLALVIHARAWGELAPVLLPVPWLIAAAVAVRARPDHPGAVLFLGLGAGHLIAFALSEPVSLNVSIGGWTAWTLNTVATLAYLGGFVSLGVFLATYPSGRPGSPAERIFAVGAAVLSVVGGLVTEVTSSPITLVSWGGRATIPPPSGLPLADWSVPFVVVGPLSVVVGVVLLVIRGRRASGEERRQLTWAMGAASVLALMLLATPAVDHLSPALQTASFLAVVSVLPFVLLAGLVRFRLMDVDLYVSRTIARGAVAVLVLSAYALIAGLAGRAHATVAAVLAVVAALTGVPLVRVLERLLDRWLFGGRLRGAALLRQLSEQLVVPGAAEQAQRTADIVKVSLDASWVRLSVESLDDAGGVDVVVGVRPAGAPPSAAVTLAAGAAQVGRLECGPRHGGWGPGETAELTLLAKHAGLALHNAELAARLEQQIVELKASRRRIVRAELAARKRLERDLHDGVQQQIIAVIAHLGAVKMLPAGDHRTATIVATALEQAQATMTELRQLVNGVQPPALLDQGLVAAVTSRSAMLPIPVEVRHATTTTRWDAELESAAYYVISEALTNVVKHAQASHADVEIADFDGDLVIGVHDDGIGMAPPLARSGLAGLRDRVEALDGDLRIEPGPSGLGTSLTARLPLGQRARD